MSLRTFKCCCLMVTLCGPLGTDHVAQAQLMIQPGRNQLGSQPEFHHIRRLPHDGGTQTFLSRAVEAIDEGNVTKGLESLQLILDDGIDFFTISGTKIDGTLRIQVETLIRQHRDDYERLQGTMARQLLTQAVTDRDVQGIQDVVRRFSLTEAGRDAISLLVRISQGKGDLGRGAYYAHILAMHPLEKSPQAVARQAAALALADQAPRTARSLIESTQTLTVPEIDGVLQEAARSAGAEVPLGVEVAGIDWRNPFGAGNQGAHAGIAPVIGPPLWSAPLIEPYDFEESQRIPDIQQKLIQEARKAYQATRFQVRNGEKRVVFPTGRPLVIGDQIIVAGPGTIKSHLAESGEHLWTSVEIDPAFQSLFMNNDSPQRLGDVFRSRMMEVVTSVRGFLDRTQGAISSDGKYVYAIMDCQSIGTSTPQKIMQNRQRNEFLPQATNLLVQLSLSEEGKARETLGTPKRQFSGPFDEEPERSIFFLGAPLPLDGLLYVLGEEQGQIQLFAIDPESFSIRWSVGLLNPDQNITLADQRRISGLVPAYGGGLLICPTGEGVVCAVDPVRRQLIWSHQYRNPVDERTNLRMNQRFFVRQNQVRDTVNQLLDEERWVDSRMLILGDSVAFTPPDHDEMLVLSVSQGQPVWRQPFPRKQWIELAGVYKDRLILLGRLEIQSFHLADGTPAWKEPVPIPSPSGRGVRMGDQYFQPLATNEIAVIDLNLGRLLGVFPVPGDEPPGNLVAMGGRMFSQNSTGLTAFRSRSELEQDLLASGPRETFESLERLGQWQLQQGLLQQGFASLQKSLALGPAPVARKVIVSTLIDGLRTDFATFRGLADNMKSLIQGEREHREFLWVYAKGLQSQGETLPALRSYLSLLESLPAEGGELRSIESGWKVTDRRWLLARLEELLDPQFDVDSRSRRDFMSWIETTSNPLEGLRILNGLPVSWFPEDLILRMARQAPAGDRETFLAMSLLSKLGQSDDPRLRAVAAMERASLCLRIGDGDQAERWLVELGGRLGDVPLPSGEPARQFAVSLRTNAQYAPVLKSVPNWPRTVTLSDDQKSVPSNPQRVSPAQIPIIGPISPQFDGWTFFISASGQEIEVFDSSGRLRDKLKTDVEQPQGMAAANLARHIETCGPLAMVVMADRMMIFDASRLQNDPRRTISRFLITERDSPYINRSYTIPTGRFRPGMRTLTGTTPTNTLAGNTGPLTSSIVCLGYGPELIALDPWSGDELWKRQGIAQGSEVFGDERYVVVRQPMANVLTVHRAADGAILHVSPIPNSAIGSSAFKEMGDWGRFLPCVSQQADSLTWGLFDPATRAMSWELKFPGATVWTTVNGFDLAFLTPQGDLTIHSGRTGTEFFRSQMPLEAPVGRLTVIEYPEQYLAVTGETPGNFGRQETFGIETVDPIRRQVEGRMISFDRTTGKEQWSRTLEPWELLTQYPKKWPVLILTAREMTARKVNLSLVHRFSGVEISRDNFPMDDHANVLTWSGETQPMRFRIRAGKGTAVFDCRDPLTLDK